MLSAERQEEVEEEEEEYWASEKTCRVVLRTEDGLQALCLPWT